LLKQFEGDKSYSKVKDNYKKLIKREEGIKRNNEIQ